ncbi:type II membrane protein [Saitoella coloradoensis]
MYSPLLLLPLIAAYVAGDCKYTVNDHTYDLAPLAGPHSVSSIWDTPPSVTNTTYTIDVCGKLRKAEGMNSDDFCDEETRVCSVTRVQRGDQSLVSRVVSIARDPVEPSLAKLSDDREGFALAFHNGKNSVTNRAQSARTEFICEKDAAKEGLTYKSIEYGGETTVVHLEWHTRFACLDVPKNLPPPEKDGKHGERPPPSHDDDRSRSWGFFTWLIIVVFLVVAAYIIVGSFLNYNRYGATSWSDLLPHAESLRDLPWLMKDFGRACLDVIKGRRTATGGYEGV